LAGEREDDGEHNEGDEEAGQRTTTASTRAEEL
jgi:hypothetical protein